MTEAIVARIIAGIGEVDQLYHRLVLVVAPGGSGKTGVMQELAARLALAAINVNLELSRRLLELTARQRRLQLAKLLADLVRQSGQDIVLLDNIEILFAVDFGLDPLLLLQELARHHTVVATWNGAVVNGYLTYAVPPIPNTVAIRWLIWWWS